MTARWQTHLNRVRELDGMLQFAWTHRAMFGGAMLYADGQPIASLSDGSAAGLVDGGCG
jgi:TfoX/Sxy family transcriptional regulator of competence genes